MGQAAPFIMIALTAASTIYSYETQRKAANEAEDIAEMNAANAELEAQEQARRLAENQRRVRAEAAALAGASGASAGFGTYLTEMEEVHGEELEWLRKAGIRQAEIIKKGGAQAYQQGMAGAYQSLFQGSTKMGQYASDYWG